MGVFFQHLAELFIISCAYFHPNEDSAEKPSGEKELTNSRGVPVVHY